MNEHARLFFNDERMKAALEALSHQNTDGGHTIYDHSVGVQSLEDGRYVYIPSVSEECLLFGCECDQASGETEQSVESKEGGRYSQSGERCPHNSRKSKKSKTSYPPGRVLG